MSKNQHKIELCFWLWRTHRNTQCKSMPKNACHIAYCRKIASLHNCILFIFSIFSYCLLLFVSLNSSLGIYSLAVKVHSELFVVILFQPKNTNYSFYNKHYNCVLHRSMKGMFPKKSLLKFWHRGQTEFLLWRGLTWKTHIYALCLWWTLFQRKGHPMMRVMWGRISCSIDL